MKFQVKRVKGAQADGARKLGLVKIAESSARDLFDMGIPLVYAGSKAAPWHFFEGWGLAGVLDSQRYHQEGVPFERFRNRFNANSDELGRVAFFVDNKYVADVDPKRRRHRAR